MKLFRLKNNFVGLAWILLGLGGLGCQLPRPHTRAEQPFTPPNVYQWPGRLPADVKRVAVLPMTANTDTGLEQAGVESLFPVLLTEFERSKRFELVPVTPTQLREWTGRRSWQAEDLLPPDLFRFLQEKLDCDAVLFSRLNTYHGYPPLRVGWNLKLIRLAPAQALWALDELFDASEPLMEKAARAYQKHHEPLPAALADSRSILLSPARFGRFAAQASFATLPER